jgi:hypothetical protein
VAEASSVTLEQTTLRHRWIERWPALTHGVGYKSMTERLRRGLWKVGNDPEWRRRLGW